jgi:RNA polymerase sigma factor (sigma-70 family)
MMTPPDSDRELLVAYAAQRSQRAFAELVARYADMVFRTALRRTRNREMAEDVTQAVFIVLARNALSLGSRESVAGWLHKTTLFAASDATRAEARRKRRESQGIRPEVSVPPDTQDETISHVEQALHRLPRNDREILVMHYLRGLTMPQTAEALGIGVEAARKRLSRALERLRARLKCSTEVGAIATAMGAIAAGSSSIDAAPLVSAAIAGGHNGSAFTLAANLLHALRVIALKKAAAALAFIGLFSGAISISVAQLAPAPKPTPPTTAPTTTIASDPATWRPILERFDRSRQSIRTISAHFDVQLTSTTQMKVFWAIDGIKEVRQERTTAPPSDSYYRSWFINGTEMLEGMISETQPAGTAHMSQFWIFPDNRSGRYFNLLTYFGDVWSRRGMVAEFDELARKGFIVTSHQEQLNGKPVTVIEAADPKVPSKGRYTFDSDHGSLLRYEGSGFAVSVDEFKQFGPDLWLQVRYTEKMGPNNVRIFSTQDLSVNASIDPQVFQVLFPENSAILDYRTRTTVYLKRPVDLEDFSVEHINGLEPIAQEFRPMPPAGTTRPASTEGRDSGDPQSVPHAWQNIISAAGLDFHHNPFRERFGLHSQSCSDTRESLIWASTVRAKTVHFSAG